MTDPGHFSFCVSPLPATVYLCLCCCQLGCNRTHAVVGHFRVVSGVSAVSIHPPGHPVTPAAHPCRCCGLQVERNLVDAMGVARNICLDPHLVPGGGSCEMAVSRSLAEMASKLVRPAAHVCARPAAD
jgi:hypothetical protein